MAWGRVALLTGNILVMSHYVINSRTQSLAAYLARQLMENQRRVVSSMETRKCPGAPWTTLLAYSSYFKVWLCGRRQNHNMCLPGKPLTKKQRRQDGPPLISSSDFVWVSTSRVLAKWSADTNQVNLSSDSGGGCSSSKLALFEEKMKPSRPKRFSFMWLFYLKFVCSSLSQFLLATQTLRRN